MFSYHPIKKVYGRYTRVLSRFLLGCAKDVRSACCAAADITCGSFKETRLVILHEAVLLRNGWSWQKETPRLHIL